jgi:hypothetical protein
MLAILGSQSDVTEGPTFQGVTYFRLANKCERFEASYCHNLEAQEVQAEVGNLVVSSCIRSGTILRKVDK